jgi:hypothetical protein
VDKKKEKKRKRRGREFCLVCRSKIKVMAFRGTGVCCGDCDDKRQAGETID